MDENKQAVVDNHVSDEKSEALKVKEPFLRIAKRDYTPFTIASCIRALGILIALIISALFIVLITDLNPLKVYVSMFSGAFGTATRTWITIRDVMFLLCISVGLAPAFKMRFWNIGAEGQVLIGALVTAACMIYLSNLPTYALLILMFILSIIAGALWGLLPAIFKAKWNTNETLFTLMMNYVAIQLVEFFVDIWDKKQSHSVGQINSETMVGWIPSVFGMKYFYNVVIVVILTIFVYIYLKYTKHGYEIAVVGESINTAKYAGINVRRVIIRTMLLSGAICGLAGFIEVAGISHTISKASAGGLGFTAIIVAWLSKFNTLAMAAVSFLIVFLDRGAVQIATDFGLNEYASEIIMSIILFFILGSEFFINYRLIFRRSKRKGADVNDA
ncbi:MAG: ABC transporter permease [Clostridiales bacterium]|nr:ABC transporter permease [Clostridiales bacterium]